MDTDRRIVFAPNIVVGLGIALFGVVLLLDRAGIADAWALFRYWPVLLILFGASIIWQAFRGDPQTAGAPHVRPRPIITPGHVFLIVVLGAIASRGNDHWARTVSRESSEAEPALLAVMGQVSETSHAPGFRGARLSSVMGGSRLNLRGATIAQGEEAVIDVFVLMGEAAVRVPKGWTVKIDTVPVMGQVRDLRTPGTPANDVAWDPSPAPQDADGDVQPPPVQAGPQSAPPRLVLRGVVLMGRLRIQS